MTLAEALAIRLTELMKKENLTNYALFKKTGVSQSTIGDIKRKKYTSAHLHKIFELCQGLGIDLATFFDSPLFRGDNIVD